ncbi:MAG: hypothetical protein ABSH16_08885 [Sedimentisphaerales bacterium]
MKKYILAFLVLCLIEGTAGWRNAAQPKEPQSRVTAAIEIQTADGPAYLVCIETTDNMSPGRLRGLTIPGIRELQSSIANFSPDSVTVMGLALCGYLLGGRRR